MVLDGAPTKATLQVELLSDLTTVKLTLSGKNNARIYVGFDVARNGVWQKAVPDASVAYDTPGPGTWTYRILIYDIYGSGHSSNRKKRMGLWSDAKSITVPVLNPSGTPSPDTQPDSPGDNNSGDVPVTIRVGNLTIFEAKRLMIASSAVMTRAAWAPLRRIRRSAPNVYEIHNGTSGAQWRVIAAGDLTVEDHKARDWMLWQAPSNIVDAQTVTDSSTGAGVSGVTQVGAPAHSLDMSTLPGGVSPTSGSYMAFSANGIWFISAWETQWRFVAGGIPQI